MRIEIEKGMLFCLFIIILLHRVAAEIIYETAYWSSDTDPNAVYSDWDSNGNAIAATTNVLGSVIISFAQITNLDPL